MSTRNYQSGKTFQVSRLGGLDKTKDYKLKTDYMGQGSLPEHMYGWDGTKHGSSQFSQIAHHLQQQKHVHNLLNNDVADQVGFSVLGPDGNKLTGPVPMNGKIYHANSEGVIRITDKGKVDLRKQVMDFRRHKVDVLTEYVIDTDDETAAYIFGISLSDWETACSAGNQPKDMEKKLHTEMLKLECSVEYLHSLPPGILQNMGMAKLRKLVEFYEPNVNMEGLSTVEDFNSNVKDGKNVNNIPANPADPATIGAGAAGAAGGK